MDFFNKFKDLVKESLLCKSFKGLSTAKIVLCAIALAPFIAAYVAMLLVYWLFAVIYRFACNQLDYIHSFIVKERAEVRHATEAVVYAVAFPFIFLMKVLTGLLAAALMFIHFFTSMIGYIATFGGIKFSPFVFDDVDRFKCRAAVKHNKSAVTVFVIIGLVLLGVSVLFAPIANAIHQNWVETIIKTMPSISAYRLATASALFAATVSVVDLAIKTVYALFVMIYVAIYSNVGQRKKYIANLSPAPENEE